MYKYLLSEKKMEFLVLIILLIVIRSFEFHRFMKILKTRCRNYDRKHIDANPDLALDYMIENYHTKCDWSAFKFVFFNGPSPINIFFSFKILRIENIYNKDIVEKLNRYENI